jgi:hypothetical protein
LKPLLALAEALSTSPAAFVQFDKEENSEKVLRKKIEGLVSKPAWMNFSGRSRILPDALFWNRDPILSS